jgi:CHAT domain-containing protein/tetratricopeptide (TPR) repeat protein
MSRLLTALVLGVMPASTAWAAAPPATSRPLTVSERAQLFVLEQQKAMQFHLANFEEVERLAQQVLALRERVQGKRHWQTVDCRAALEHDQRQRQVPAARRADLIRVVGLRARADALGARGRYREAEQAYRDALVLCRKTLGEKHCETVLSCNNLATCLDAQGKHAQARRLLEHAVAICFEALGEEHFLTALCYNNLAGNLNSQGGYSQARRLYEKALAIRKSVLGEQHPHTANTCNYLAMNLNAQGRYAEAQALFEQALAINQKVLSEEHPNTAASYHNLALNLKAQGKYAQARPLLEKALAICRKTLGEEHLNTAINRNSLAILLYELGKYAEAQLLVEKALVIRRQALGEEHPATASSYNELALNLDAQGKYAEARPLHEKVLAIHQKAFGLEHPHTATSFSNLAFNLDAQDKYAEARPLHEKALAIHQKVFGLEHPRTAISFSNLAFNLAAEGKPAEAGPLFEQVLAIRRKVLGEQHPDTALSYGNLAGNCSTLGKHAQARELFAKALAIHEKTLGQEHPHTASSHYILGVVLWNLGKRDEAVVHWRAASRVSGVFRIDRDWPGFDRSLGEGIAQPPHLALAAALARQGKALEAFGLAETGLARGLLDSLGTETAIQGREHSARLARVAQLDRLLVPLLGRSDLTPMQRTSQEALLQERADLLAELSRQAARDAAALLLPLADIQKQISADTALVLWIDASSIQEHWACVVRSTGPPHWQRLPGSGPGRSWTGDDERLPSRLLALLRNPDSRPAQRQRLLRALRRQRLEPLRPHLKGVRRLLLVPTFPMEALPVEVLNEDHLISYVPSASYFARRMAEHRPLRGTSLLAVGDPVFLRGSGHQALPGTRHEVQTLARLVPEATVLLGSTASEQNLAQLAGSGKLKRFRLLHLATHGEVNPLDPKRSALLLSQDRLPPRPVEAVLRGHKPLDRRLTVETILQKWELDADLVVLSACQTGLGLNAGGEGLLGFAQAFLQKKARAVVVSRWKVDDTATTLFMVRFYENLLGQRKDLKKPLGRADALDEARKWLRNLERKRAVALAGKLERGTLRGSEVEVPALAEKTPALPAGDHPYAHPYYWAAFVLIGDPD